MQQPDITPERIKEIAGRCLGDNKLVVGEAQAIYTAAQKDPFNLVCYAYAYGFYRGTQAVKKGTA